MPEAIRSFIENSLPWTPPKEIPARLRANPLGVDVHTRHSERVANQPGSPKTKESAASAKQARSNLDVRIYPRRTWFRPPLDLRGTHDNPHSTFQHRTAGSHPIDTQGLSPRASRQEALAPMARGGSTTHPARTGSSTVAVSTTARSALGSGRPQISFLTGLSI